MASFNFNGVCREPDGLAGGYDIVEHKHAFALQRSPDDAPALSVVLGFLAVESVADANASAVAAASGMPLYAGPKTMSNAGSTGRPAAAAASEPAIVEAYAEQSVSSAGPSAIRPALKKYGEMLRGGSG